MTTRTTPLLGDLLQVEPGDGDALRIGAEFLASREAQIQARLVRLEAELAGSEGLPETRVLERQAADALQALLDLLQPDGRPAPGPAATTPPPAAYEPPLPAPGQRGLRLALGLAVAAWLITLALAGWLLWQRSQPIAGTPILTTTVVVSPTAHASQADRADRATTAPRPGPAATTRSSPTIPGSSARVEQIAQAAELRLPDGSGRGYLQVPLAVMAETIRVDDGRPVLHLEPPAGGAGLHRASAPFGERGATVIALPPGAVSSKLQALRPGDRLAGCNAGGRCYDYGVTAAEWWQPARLSQVLGAWPPDLGLLIYTVPGDGDVWIVQARPEGETR